MGYIPCFPTGMFCEEERINRGSKRILLVMLFGFYINNLPCHVGTFRSDVHASCGYSIYQTGGVV